MLHPSNIKEKGIDNNHICKLISPIKYKKINLVSLNKSIVRPSFNSLANYSTKNKSYSFNHFITSITKKKYIPKIKKFNDSNEISPSLKIKPNNTDSRN